MKITCSQSELVKGVNIVSKAVPTRTTMAILECILIDASKGQIVLTANDMEIGIETIVEGNIIEPGIVALDARFFGDIVRNLPNSDVTITVDDRFSTQILCESADFKITGKSGEDFSKIPAITRSNPVIISQFTMRELIRQTTFTISDLNQVNKMMTGELFEITGDMLKVVALDTSRISIRNIKLKESYDDKKVIVPAKALNEISKIISGSIEDMVEIFFTDNHIIFEFENTTVVSRLIDGEFFNIDHMFSGNYDTKMNINKKQLLESINRSTLMLVKEAEKKPIVMDITDNNLTLSMSSFVGKMKENISIDKKGKDVKIGFNPKFFMDALRVIDDEEITAYFVDHRSPCFIKNEDESYIYVILPVNIQEA